MRRSRCHQAAWEELAGKGAASVSLCQRAPGEERRAQQAAALCWLPPGSQ
ncbi:hypothetical protein [Methanothrix sp.]